MKKFLIAALLVLSACRSYDDGYRIERIDYDRNPVVVQFVEYPTRKEFLKSMKDHGVRPERGEEVQSFSQLYVDKNKCIIHIVKGHNPLWLGHELTHCRFGRFHK